MTAIDQKPAPSRRAFVSVAALFAGALVAFPFLRRWRASRLRTTREPAVGSVTPLGADAKRTVSHLLAAVFGHAPTPDDEAELAGKLEWLTHEDASWHGALRDFARYADDAARGAGGTGFVALSPEQREKVVAGLMQPIDTAASRRQALFSESERARRIAREDLLPVLTRIYRTSGVAWRRRGYTRWPGVPGDPREYTRPGAPYAC